MRLTLRASAPARLTRAGGFVWYEHQAGLEYQGLFDESECDGALARSHFELGQAALAAQLPLPPSHTLQLPVGLTAASEGVCGLRRADETRGFAARWMRFRLRVAEEPSRITLDALVSWWEGLVS